MKALFLFDIKRYLLPNSHRVRKSVKLEGFFTFLKIHVLNLGLCVIFKKLFNPFKTRFILKPHIGVNLFIDISFSKTMGSDGLVRKKV